MAKPFQIKKTFVVDITPRDQQLIQLAADGYSTKQIADSVHLSPSTVELYFDKLRRVMGANNRPHLVAIAFRMGMIE